MFGTLALLLANPESASDSPLLIALAVLVGIVGLIGALVKVAGSADDDTVASTPWTDSGALVQRAPEHSAADDDFSGERLAAVVEEAGATAREDGTVSSGIAVVRPYLRDALFGVYVSGGTDRATAAHSLARGTWTDDATAAAVLDEAVDHPGRSLFQRFEVWLFPEQTVRRETRQAMQAVAEVANERLPTVPGQHAPRTMPVLRPTLEDLHRGADGRLQRAVDPLGAQSGSGVDGSATVDDAMTVEKHQHRETELPSDSTEMQGDETTSLDDEMAALDDVPIGGAPDERENGAGRR